MTVDQRRTEMRVVHNIKEFVDGDHFEQEGIIGLQTRLDRVKGAWTSFTVSHSVLLGEAKDAEERQEHEKIFDEMDQDCVVLETRLKSRIEALSQIEAQARAAVRERANQFVDSDNESELGNYQANVHDDNEHQQRDAGAEPHAENQQIPAARVETPEGLAQQVLQKIVSGGSNRQIENTWGEFDGTWTHWQGFHDRFKAAVHDNEQIPSIFKFQHLMKSLKGQAKLDMGEWPQTEAAYGEMWERMKELYAQKYKTGMKFLEKFFSLPKLEKPSGFLLQKMSNTTHEVMRSLRTMNYPVDHYDLFFVYGIHERMDPDTSRAWELERLSDQPTTKEILAFLDRQAKAALFSSKGQNDGRKRGSSGRDNKNDAKRPKPSATDGSKSDSRAENRVCKVCKDNHAVHKCQVFKKMSLSERKKSARDNELCFNCLNPSHASKDCRASACKRCPDKKHNSLLCNENPLNRAVLSVQTKTKTKKGAKSEKNKPS